MATVVTTALTAATIAGCELLLPTTSPSVAPSAHASFDSVAPSGGGPGSTQAPISTPAATFRLPLSLDLPTTVDSRQVTVSVDPQLTADGSGRLVITVVSQTGSMIDELVIRWPTALADTVFLAPFEPSQERIREGGPVLNQPWTKWVVGPGESGEPAGTTSVGWGPLLGNATLTIPLIAQRVASGGLAFDLQVLAGEHILTLSTGAPAELRVALP